MMKQFKKVISIFMLCALCIGCLPQFSMEVSAMKQKDAPATVGSFSVSTSETYWSVQPTAGWIRATRNGSYVRYECTPNLTGATRTATILCIGSKGPFYTYTVTQKPFDYTESGSISVPSGHTNWCAAATASWIRINKVNNYTLNYEMLSNFSSTSRSAEIIFYDNTGVFMRKTITQEGFYS